MSSTSQPAISVVGGGAVGQSVTAALTAAGCAVRLITRTAESALRIEQSGIRITHGDVSFPSIQVSASSDPACASNSSVIVVCVKCHQTHEALTGLVPHIRKETPVVLLQNGAGAYDEAAAILPHNPIFCGLIGFGAYMNDDGMVTQYGAPAVTVVPRPDCPPCPPIDSEQLPGMNITFSRKSETAIWSKLCLNCGINATTALHDIGNGELPNDSVAWQEAVAASMEASAVAEAAGIALSYTDVENELRRICALTAGNRSSMLQDLEMMRPTEIEYINGYIVKQAARLSIDVPVNRQLRDRIRALEPKAQ